MGSVKLLDPADTGRKLDRYELIGEIASGGMATVFLARLGGLGGFQRLVAIKRLHPHLAGEPEFVQMFLDEARLAAGIHHPNVVPILEVGTGKSGYYLVMEYIEGDTLGRIVGRALSAGAPAPRPVLLRCVLDVLAGLHAAHDLVDAAGRPLGLVHRDVSPQNLLVGTDGSTRITDFGVARATSRLTTTRAGRLKGKLAYMAPETTEGVVVDRRADVFAMGIILWEVLASERLFKAENEAATLSRLLHKPIPSVSSVAPDVPEAFDEVCAKALERDPDRRYQTAAEMADALERAARRASASSSESMLAMPREVASYVQALLGDQILAQRESVRAWLAQSGPYGMAEIGADGLVTIRMPLDHVPPAAHLPSTAQVPSAAAAPLVDDDDAFGDTVVADRSRNVEPLTVGPPQATPRAWPPPVDAARTVPDPRPPPPRQVPKGAPTLRGMPAPGPPGDAPPQVVLQSPYTPALDPTPAAFDLEAVSTRKMPRAPVRTLASPSDPSQGAAPRPQTLVSEGAQPFFEASRAFEPPQAFAPSHTLEPSLTFDPTQIETSTSLRAASEPWKKRTIAVAVVIGALAGGYVMWLVLRPLMQPGRGEPDARAVAAASAPPSAASAAAQAPVPEASTAPIASAEPPVPVAAVNADPPREIEPGKTEAAKGASTAKKGKTGKPPPKGDGDDLVNPYR